MEEKIAKLKRVIRGEVAFDVPMNEHTSWKVGGPAAAIASPVDVDDLIELVEYLRAMKIDYRPLGDGTNLLVKDGGYPGVFIRLGSAFEKIETLSEDEKSVTLKVGSALRTGRLVRYAAENGLAGPEILAGIPGRIGGAIYGNAGGKKKAIGDLVEAVYLIDRKPKQTRRSADACGFDYRSTRLAYKEIVVAVEFVLARGDRAAIAAEIDKARSAKRETQPLDFPTCGSVFKNPKRRSAGELIEKAGLKGVRVRGAAVSEKHANFIINLGDATASDVLALINLIKERIKAEFGVTLVTEVVIVGRD